MVTSHKVTELESEPRFLGPQSSGSFHGTTLEVPLPICRRPSPMPLPTPPPTGARDILAIVIFAPHALHVSRPIFSWYLLPLAMLMPSSVMHLGA